jgi:hypothetical protein
MHKRILTGLLLTALGSLACSGWNSGRRCNATVKDCKRRWTEPR